MLLRTPSVGEVIYEYLPVNLGNFRKKYTTLTWQNLDYCYHRLNAGLLYATEEEVQQRVLEETKLCLLRQIGGTFNLLENLNKF